jgi:integrase
MLFAKLKLKRLVKKREAKRAYYFGDFVKSLAGEMKVSGQERTGKAYQTVCNSFLSFNEGRNVKLEEIDSRSVKRYEVYLRKNGKQPNTISFYMRNFRAILNKARKAGLLSKDQEYSFEDVYTGIDETAKRAVKKEIIHKFSGLDLSLKKGLKLSQDIFMFSFYTRGMSFIDMAFLKKSDVKNGVIRYRRHKTGRWLEIKVIPEISGIIDNYTNETKQTEYLLPIIKGKSRDSRREYETALKTHNNRLKCISELLKLKVRLTSYVARHSWATIAKDLNIPLPVISEGLGHNSPQTTQIYLASFDSAVLHRANAKVIA